MGYVWVCGTWLGYHLLIRVCEGHSLSWAVVAGEAVFKRNRMKMSIDA